MYDDERRNTDAFWCGSLSQALRLALQDLEAGSTDLATETLRDALRRYDDETGFLPPDAVGVEESGPGVREINGQLWFSSAWLDKPDLRVV